MPLQETDLVDQRKELEDSSLCCGTMTEVGAHGLQELVLVVHDALEQKVQSFEALFEPERSASAELAFLTIEDLSEVHSGNGSAGVVGVRAEGRLARAALYL